MKQCDDLREMMSNIPEGMKLKDHQLIEKCNHEIAMMTNVQVLSAEDEVTAHKIFRERIDKLGHPQMCHVCEESYPSIQVVTTKTGSMCRRCKREGSTHIFSSKNHMNLGL